MANKEKYRNIEYVFDCFRGVLPFYGLAPSIIKLIFLKYLCDFSHDAMNIEDYKALRNLQTNIYSEYDIRKDCIYDAWKMIQRIYSLYDYDILNSYDFISSLDENRKRQVKEILRMIELPTNVDEMKDLILYIMSLGERDVTRTAMSFSNTSLIKLAEKILDVKSKESFMDSFCGYNKTSLFIEAASYCGYEINSDVAIVAVIIMIMMDKNNFKVFNRDFYYSYQDFKVDKIFTDGPISGIIHDADKLPYDGGKRAEIYNVKFTLDRLTENGKAFVTVPASVLFSMNRSNVNLRKDILENVSAVLNLPPLWYGTNIPTCVLVLEKNKKNNEILFVDASNKGVLNKSTRTYSLLDSDIDFICDSLLNNVETKEFSSLININEINESNGYILSPSKYIEKGKIESFRKVDVIQKELNELYEKLNKLI